MANLVLPSLPAMRPMARPRCSPWRVFTLGRVRLGGLVCDEMGDALFYLEGFNVEVVESEELVLCQLRWVGTASRWLVVVGESG